MEEYNPQKAIKRQFDYCKENKLPAFFFPSHNGTCYGCHKNIFMPEYFKRVGDTWNFVPGTADDHDRVYGIIVKEAGERLITGCPHCNRSYCD